MTVPAQEERPIGIWGQRHLRYIKAERKALYTELPARSYLASINEQAEEQMLFLTRQMAERDGVTEQLKEQDQMLWGAGLRWRPLPQAEAPTEPAGGTSG